MNRPIAAFITLLALSLFIPSAVYSQPKAFVTQYTTIHYEAEKDINDFIWKLGGQKLEIVSDKNLASNRVDRIVERVQNILDMRPGRFKVHIYLSRGALDKNKVAYYDPETRSIHVSVDNISDGAFAHEIAHAIINQNFGTILPSKMQEILTQYVDKYLWNDYY